MKIKAVRDGNKIVFDNFVVIPESDNFFEIYEKDLLNQSITSGSTLQQACKKAKLLQLGYNLFKNNCGDNYF